MSKRIIMFKSVFAKYITAFMLIIFASFIMLALITATAVNNYSADEKAEIMARSADSSKTYIEEKFNNEDNSYFDLFVSSNAGDIGMMLKAISLSSDDVTVVVADNNGNILLSAGTDASSIPDGAIIPRSLMDEVNSGNKISGFEKIDGVFDEPNLVSAAPIMRNNNVVGSVLVFSDSLALEELMEVIIKTIVLSSLWVMIAALVAVYFVSERVISPLKSISRAAKKFAAGQFDVRVEVKGKDEVAELATAFNNMAMSLDNYETMRNTFMANVSHDLRTPMTTISGFIDGMLAGAIPPEKHDYYLGVIASEARRLSRLVASLLDISRIQAGDRKFVMAPFDACEMARQILISFEQKIDQKRLDVEFDCPEDSMFVKADRDAIHQVLYNICDNAVKFSNEKGKLSLTLAYTKDKKVEISVYNEGMGIPADDLPYVFERFYKSDKSRGLDKLGVGLGMFITKTIIDAHGETVRAESEYGKYCRFVFTLPRTDIIADAKHNNPEEEEII